VRFATEEKVVVLADEVYQENIYQGSRPFVSCRHVARGMGEPYASGLEIASFHTVSKGVYGECGMRGGAVELLNFDNK
jgi:glutamate--glyoxylate aminotransferase